MSQNVGILIITLVGIVLMIGISGFFIKTMINTVNYHNTKSKKNKY